MHSALQSVGLHRLMLKQCLFMKGYVLSGRLAQKINIIIITTIIVNVLSTLPVCAEITV